MVKNSYVGAKGLTWGSVYVYGLKANKISWVKANENEVTKNSTIDQKTQVNYKNSKKNVKINNNNSNNVTMKTTWFSNNCYAEVEKLFPPSLSLPLRQTPWVPEDGIIPTLRTLASKWKFPVFCFESSKGIINISYYSCMQMRKNPFVVKSEAIGSIQCIIFLRISFACNRRKKL